MDFNMSRPGNEDEHLVHRHSQKQLMQKPPFSRWKAATIHLGISIAIAIGAVLLLYLLWYPQPFFEASGGQFLLTLLVAVDVVLGPLITLIIFDTKKKSLRFDLAVIVIVQLAAIGYGMYTMYLARPVFVVYSNSQFKVVTANEIEPEMLAQVTRVEHKSLSFTGPKYVFNNPPESGTDLDAVMLSGEGLAPQFYVPFSEKSADAAKQGQPLTELFKRQPDAQSIIDVALKRNQKNATDVVYFPLIAKAMNMTLLADTRTGAIVAVVPVNPL